MKKFLSSLDFTVYFFWIMMIFYTVVICYAITTSDKFLGRAHKFAVITVDSKEYRKIRLSEPTELDIRGAHISIAYGRVCFTDSDCADKTCVKGGKIIIKSIHTRPPLNKQMLKL